MKAEQWVAILARDPDREIPSAVRDFSALSAALMRKLCTEGDYEEIVEAIAEAVFALRVLREIFGVGNLEVEERIQRKTEGFPAEKGR